MGKPFHELGKSQKANLCKQLLEHLTTVSGGDPSSLLRYALNSRKGKELLPSFNQESTEKKFAAIVQNIQTHYNNETKEEKKKLLSIISTSFTKNELETKYNFRISKNQFA